MPARDEQNRIKALYRETFNDAPPILMMTMGALEPGRVSESQAWKICERAALSGEPLQFVAIPVGVDI